MKKWIKRLNPTIVTNSMDIIVVEYPDGSMRSSPWNIRFGQLGLPHHLGKIASIENNDVHIPAPICVDNNGVLKLYVTQSRKSEL